MDAARLDTIAEDRLRHYNAILDEQARELQVELDEIDMPFRMELDLFAAKLAPAQVLATLARDRAELERNLAKTRHDLEAYRDPQRLKALLRGGRRPRKRV